MLYDQIPVQYLYLLLSKLPMDTNAGLCLAPMHLNDLALCDISAQGILYKLKIWKKFRTES